MRYRSIATIVLLSSLFLSACSSNNNQQPGAASSASVPGQQRVSEAAKAYQATYSSPNNFAYKTAQFYSDGKGHVRMDIVGEGITPTVVNVLDLNSQQAISWVDGSNQFIRKPAEPMDPLVMRINSAHLGGADAIGARTIDGHKCHGFKSGEATIWFDDDYGCPVDSTAGGIETTMTAFSPQEPDPSVFQPPAGYTQAETPQAHGFGRQWQSMRIMNDVRRLQH